MKREFTYEVRVIKYANGTGSYGESFTDEIDDDATSEIVTGTGTIEIAPEDVEWTCEGCDKELAGRPYAKIAGNSGNGGIEIDECAECFLTGDSFGKIEISAEK